MPCKGELEEGEGREGGDGGGGETGKGAQPVITSDLIAGKRHEACACGVVYAYAWMEGEQVGEICEAPFFFS